MRFLPSLILATLPFVALPLAALADTPPPAPRPLPVPPPPPWLLSKEERQRQDELANADRQRLMDLLGVREAKDLPPEESDPNRPAGLTRPANNPNGWTDAAGRYHRPAGGQAAARYRESFARHLRRLKGTTYSHGDLQ